MKKQKHKIIAGADYPKDKILELVDIFGLEVEMDKWDEKGITGWMRIVSLKYPDAEHIYLHKHHLEFAVHNEQDYLTGIFQTFLIEIGEREFKKKLNDLIKL